MPKYTYKAVNLQGTKIKGNYEAENECELKEILRLKGFFLLSFRSINKLFITLLNYNISSKELSLFCRKFYVILDAGIPILKGIDILSKQAFNINIKTNLKKIYESVLLGESLNESMDKLNNLFPKFMINMVRIGEYSGSLPQILLSLAEYYNKDYIIKRKIKNALTYPALVFVVTIIIMLFLFIKIIPILMQTLVSLGGKLPPTTKLLMNISSFIKNYIMIMLLCLIIVLLGLVYFRKNIKKSLDSLKLKLPIIGQIYKKLAISRLSSSISMLLISGVSIVKSLEIIIDRTDNEIIKNIVEMSLEKIQNGSNFSSALMATNFFDPMTISMVIIGEETGKMEEMLKKGANILDDDIYETIEKITTYIEPLMIIILSLMVGTIIISVVLPMFEVMNAIGR